MNEKAISTFIFLTEISYDFGLITKNVQLQRIKKLYELIGIKNVAEFFPDIPMIERTKEKQGFKPETEKAETRQNSILKISDELFSENKILHFVSCKSGKFCKWKFYEYDKDDKPSIPHGHGIEISKLKLDPFRALIFDINIGFDKYISSENDDFIKYLWNSDDFRKVATINIKHHITDLNKHPLYWINYRGIRHNPLRLPRKRRK